MGEKFMFSGVNFCLSNWIWEWKALRRLPATLFACYSNCRLIHLPVVMFLMLSFFNFYMLAIFLNFLISLFLVHIAISSTSHESLNLSLSCCWHDFTSSSLPSDRETISPVSHYESPENGEIEETEKQEQLIPFSV